MWSVWKNSGKQLQVTDWRDNDKCKNDRIHASESSALGSDTHVSVGDSVRRLSRFLGLALKQTLADFHLHFCLEEKKYIYIFFLQTLLSLLKMEKK